MTRRIEFPTPINIVMNNKNIKIINLSVVQSSSFDNEMILFGDTLLNEFYLVSLLIIK